MSECTLLVVDDHSMLRRMLADLARCAGFDRVWTAETAADAVELVNNRPPDVMLIDYRLKLDNGCRLGETIRKSCPDALCVIMSALADDEMREAREDCGPDVEFIDKADLTLDELRRLRDRVCDKRGDTKQHRSPAA